MGSLPVPVLNYTRCDQFLQKSAVLILQLHLKGSTGKAMYISECVNKVCNEVNKLRV